MISEHRRKTETSNRQEFRQSLKLLDRSRSWLLWSSVSMLLLIIGAIVLLTLPSPPPRLGSLDEQNLRWLICGLLGLMVVLSMFILRHQYLLRVFRNRLIEQIEAATKHRLQAERFYEMSMLDPLTSLYNRRYGETRLREEIARAEKSGDSLLLLALDFDDFKEINDRYGHAAGDLALKAFSRRLQRAIRACDVPIRVGGDEFLVILPECSADKLPNVLSRLDNIELNLDGQKVGVPFSWGMAQYQVNDTSETIIRRADERLYIAKSKRPEVDSAPSSPVTGDLRKHVGQIPETVQDQVDQLPTACAVCPSCSEEIITSRVASPQTLLELHKEHDVKCGKCGRQFKVAEFDLKIRMKSLNQIEAALGDAGESPAGPSDIEAESTTNKSATLLRS